MHRLDEPHFQCSLSGMARGWGGMAMGWGRHSSGSDLCTGPGPYIAQGLVHTVNLEGHDQIRPGLRVLKIAFGVQLWLRDKPMGSDSVLTRHRADCRCGAIGTGRYW